MKDSALYERLGIYSEDLINIIEECEQQLFKIRGLVPFMSVMATLIDEWEAQAHPDHDDLQGMLRVLPDMREVVDEVMQEIENDRRAS